MGHATTGACPKDTSMSPSPPRQASPSRRQAIAALVILLLAASLFGTGRVGVADAWAQAACSASIGGQRLGEGTAVVDQHGNGQVTGTGRSATNEVSIRYAGIPLRTVTVPSGGTTTVSVPHYASVPGLYQLVWESGVGCRIEGAVEVQGNSFLGRPVGWVSTATIALALPLLLILSWKTTINPRGRWKLKVVADGNLKRDDDGWRFRWGLAVTETLVGTLLGLLLSGATLAALAGTATSVPSLDLALKLTLPMTAIGFLLGLGRLSRPRDRQAATGRAALA